MFTDMREVSAVGLIENSLLSAAARHICVKFEIGEQCGFTGKNSVIEMSVYESDTGIVSKCFSLQG
jgi:hypothetical protein